MPDITFYDIAMRPPEEENSCSPNPWKARYALNYKTAEYKTVWVQLPDIAAVRKELAVPAVRKFADGSDYYTLPVAIDHKFNAKVGDSFEIAAHLEQHYAPDKKLFPEAKLDFEWHKDEGFVVPLSDPRGTEYTNFETFNRKVDAAFSTHAGLMADDLPFNPKFIDEIRAEFARRAHVDSWDVFVIKGEARKQLLDSLESMLKQLATLFRPDPTAPFVLGALPCYADFIVGGWLKMMHRTLPEWPQIRQWHNGLYGILYDALEPYAVVN
ncbi:hypothetical protein B9G98_00297 [Wickerhamiella sorbophila]|uniref:Glutathione S-transferase UstS-like C-terminal domain-containing protein n=1 Tax=Wickerhamiella sorbophila TaxID=45607 RepID=A0A2T0FCI0_9ASCO|nr:hypothetical protein B9G98_00297 [Wickerhamiella sorbophila]PRT52677.1 hypothetical protein B9G98_00297 [Wickerhamiella sorbophila]